MIAAHEIGNDRSHPGTAWGQGIAHWVGRIVRSAFTAGRAEKKVKEAACGAKVGATQEGAAWPRDEWSWLESRRRGVTAELNHPPEPTPELLR